MPKITTRTVSEHLNTKYRQYATHVIQSRGIPDFYDALTNVQRFIIKNSNLEATKTLKTVGDSQSNGYVHGDASLAKAIVKVAREHSNADNIIQGKGFFGTQVEKTAASARYTKIKFNKTYYDIIKKYDVLNKQDDDKWEPFHVEVPIGLVSFITGVGVAYSSNILPRRLEDIIAYLKKETDTVHPYFMKYGGKIVPLDEESSTNGKSWLIMPVVEYIETKKEFIVKITDVSPTIKYETFLNSLDKKLFEKYNPKINNQTNSKVNIELYFPMDRTSSQDIENIKKIVDKETIKKITETIIFIRDGDVISYNSIEDYLDDFRNYTKYLKRDKLSYDIVYDENRLDFLGYKIKYLDFMLAKKRNVAEIEKHFSEVPNEFIDRLDSIKLRNLNQEYYENTVKEQKELSSHLVDQKGKLEKINDILAKDRYVNKGKTSVIWKLIYTEN